MFVEDIQEILEAWAPRKLAWERDNVGLQVGSTGRRVRRILVTLDVSNSVVEEARQKKIDLIVSHHPLIFTPIRAMTEDDRTGRLLVKLARYKIALFSAHTNLDFTHSGVSTTLAEKLGLKNLDVLSQRADVYKKIVVFVPSSHSEKVMEAMSSAGAGKIGNYESCSFRVDGTGTFKGSNETHPFVGRPGSLERVAEQRLEMIVPSWNVNRVIDAMRGVHPYEEIAYDVYDLSNRNSNYGAGIIGELKRATTLRTFLRQIQRALSVPVLRYVGNQQHTVRRVAVCGGSGTELLEQAVHQHADVFITADVKYHSFQQAEDSIALVDAGHFETEVPVVQTVVEHLKSHITARGENVKIIASQQSHNPVQYFFS